MSVFKNMKENMQREYRALKANTIVKQLTSNRAGGVSKVEFGSEIEDSGLEDICRAAESCASLTHFLIRNKPLDERCISCVATLLAKTSTITTLRLSGVGLINEFAGMLFGTLLRNTTITNLAVDHNELSAPEPIAVLLQHNKSLLSLDLSYNKLGATPGTIEEIAAALPHATVLTQLNLSANGVTDTAVHSLIAALQLTTSPAAGAAGAGGGGGAAATPLRFIDLNGNPDVQPDTKAGLKKLLVSSSSMAVSNSSIVEPSPRQHSLGSAPADDECLATSNSPTASSNRFHHQWQGSPPPPQQQQQPASPPPPLALTPQDHAFPGAAHQKELEAVREALFAMQEERAGLIRRCEIASSAAGAAKAERYELQERYNELEATVAELRQEVEGRALAAAQEQIEAMEKSHNDELQAVHALVDVVKAELTSVTAERDAALLEAGQLRTEKQAAERALRQAVQRAEELKHALDSVAAARNRPLPPKPLAVSDGTMTNATCVGLDAAMEEQQHLRQVRADVRAMVRRERRAVRAAELMKRQAAAAERELQAQEF